MKKVYAAVLMLLTNFAFGQVLYEESFETNTNGTNYNTSIAEFSDGSGDFFTRTDGSNISTGYQVTNIDGSFYFAGMDIDGEGATLPVTLSTATINLGGASAVDFAVSLAEDDDGTNQDWDDNDYLHITYSVDGGAQQNLIWIENDGSQFNGAPLIDTDFDGTGDGAEITSVFTEYTETIGLPGASTIEFFFETNLNSGDEDIAIDNIVVTENTDPTVNASPTTLTGFQQFIGNPSAEQTFTTEGFNLTDDISLNVTSGDYEISTTSGTGFGTTLTLPQSGGVVNTTTIYVRLNGTTAQNPANGDITITSTGAPNQVVNLEGEILTPDPTVNVSTNTLSGFSHFVGTPSAEQTINVSGDYLTDDLIVTAPANFEVSLTSGSGFGTSVSLTPTSGTVPNTPVYVRLNGPQQNLNQSGDIVVASNGATDENVALTGETFEYILYPIGPVSSNDANNVADSLGVYVELRGIVHCIDFLDGDGYNVTIIDGPGDGIQVYNFNQVSGYNATEGDSIAVKGQIDQFNGLTQVFAEEITVLTQGEATVTPDLVTVLDESTESQLVKMENMTLVNGEMNWPSNDNIDITGGNTVFTVRVTDASPLANASTPNGPFDITGIGGQYDSSSPYDDGYQLFPCSVEELCNVDITTTTTDLTIEANATNADYQWIDCDDNNAPIAGETNKTFTATANGNYAVIITDGNCVDTSDCVAITTVGIDVANDVKVRAYPNPVQEKLTIDVQGASLMSFEVINVAGQLVASSEHIDEVKTLETVSWEAGVYLVKIHTTAGTKTVKVMK